MMFQSPHLAPDSLVQGRYRIVRVVGQGGMGVVYEAKDERLNNTVALKQMLVSGQQLDQAFEREARLLAGLRHSGLPKVMDYFINDQGHFLVMEFIGGQDLAALMELQQSPFPVQTVLRWAYQLLEALEYLHNQRPPIIHRDIKPQNLKLTDRNEVILLDFGLAKNSDLTLSQATANHSVYGYTPQYSPPEQIHGAGTDARSDIYALAATIYFLLVGTAPASALTRTVAFTNDEPDPLRPPHELRHDLPLAISRVVMKAMAIKAALRYQTATAMLDALHEADSYAPHPASPIPSTIVAGRESDVRTIGRVTSIKRLPPPDTSAPVVYARHRSILVGLLTLLMTAVCVGIPIAAFATATPLKPAAINLWLVLSLVLILIIGLIVRQGIKLRRHVRFVSQPIEPPSTLAVSSPKPPTIIVSSAQRQPEQEGIHIKYPELMQPFEHKIVEDLILHQNYEWLWRSIAYGVGGRYLLTGYGSFGGTSLIQCAIDKARRELQSEELTDSALFALYLHVTNETDESFDLRAEHVTLGRVQQRPEKNTNIDRLRPYAEQHHMPGKVMTQLLDFSLQRTLSGSFFARADPLADAEARSSTDYNLSDLADDLRNFLKSKRNVTLLRQIINNLANSKILPSNIVIVIDKIKYSSTLEKLLCSELFRNNKIKIIVLARKEDVNCWKDVDAMLQKSSFALHYIPSIWGGALSHLLFDSGLSAHNQSLFMDFCRHLDFVSKGALSNIIRELKRSNYVMPVSRGAVVNVTHLGDDVRRNAWLQRLLDSNKDSILGSRFGGKYRTEKEDRARIAIYDLLEWIERNSPFTQKQLIAYERTLSITIADDAQTAIETIRMLLDVLIGNDYLSFKRPFYRVAWNQNSAVEPRVVDMQGRTDSPKQRRKRKEDDNYKTVHINIDDDVSGSQPARTGVFISYSRKDKYWHERLQTHLKPLGRTKALDVWDYTRIKAGTAWKKEIERALASAKVAVLLVSPDFLASDFIAEQELPKLLTAAKQEGLTILWIAVRASAFESTPIAQYQAVLDPKRPLKERSSAEVDRVLVEVCKKIAAAANADAEPL